MSEEENNTTVGRPLKFATAEELDLAINNYFHSRDPHIVTAKVKTSKADGSYYWVDDEVISPALPKTMSGLAKALGIDRKTLLNYKNRDEFFPSIQRALTECEEYAEEQLFTGKSNGAAFALKNNYGWEERSHVQNYNHDVAEDLDRLEMESGMQEAARQAQLELVRLAAQP